MGDLALPEGRGRRPSEIQYKTRRAILDNTKAEDIFTTPEIANRVEKDIVEVRRSLMFFQSRGIVDLIGTDRVKGKQGKPAKKWKRIV